MTRRHVPHAAIALLLLVALTPWPAPAAGQTDAPAPEHRHPDRSPPRFNFLTPENREAAAHLAVQDFRGRMKPLDTRAREVCMKISKREHFEGWEPIDLYFSWLTRPEFWFNYPLIAVRFPGVKQLLGVSPDTKWVSAASLITPDNRYVLEDKVREALRTPDRDRSKLQRKLLKFDERFNILYDVLNGGGLRLYPLPGDPNHKWLEFADVQHLPDDAYGKQAKAALRTLLAGLRAEDNLRIRDGLQQTAALQQQYDPTVLPSAAALKAELWLNRHHPFRNVTVPYFVAFLLLLIAYFWSVFARDNAPYRWRQPLFGLGMLVMLGATLFHLYAFVLRWIASGRAPLSNGYESLIFIALATAIAGLLFEVKDRRGAAGSVAAMLTFLILAVAMLSTFDPAIGPLVPVLASYWLNIHVTVITASYGFLGVSSLLGGLMLVLYLFKGPGRRHVHDAIVKLDRLQYDVLVVGLGLLSVGTLLGGVWANESWGRYWGWDPKETWSLVTILVYAAVVHLKWIPALRGSWVQAATGTLAFASVLMTYFGVNYFLTGLHSYGAGETPTFIKWLYISGVLVALLTLTSYAAHRTRRWDRAA